MQRRDFLNTGLALSVSAITASNLQAETAAAQTSPIALPAEDELLRGKRPGFKKIKIAQIGVRHEHASGKMNTLKLSVSPLKVRNIRKNTKGKEFIKV